MRERGKEKVEKDAKPCAVLCSLDDVYFTVTVHTHAECLASASTEPKGCVWMSVWRNCDPEKS
jgi:hypothetical protein